MLYKKRLLIIDSSDNTRTTLFKELRRRLTGIDIIACGSAKEAITACKRLDFELIITDLSLSDMDGYTMIKQIRNKSKNKDTPVFAFSSDTKTHFINAENDEVNSITAFFDRAEGLKALVKFIYNFLSNEGTLSGKILYADQSATSVAVTTSILQKNNFNFLHLRDGETVLNELRMDQYLNNRCSYDVLITDLTLNRQMNGFELIQTVRNELDYDYLALPVLLMTVEPEEGEKTDFTAIFGAGTNDFITKPITEDRLIERITNLISIKRQNEVLTA